MILTYFDHQEYDETQVGPKTQPTPDAYISNMNQLPTSSYNAMSTNYEHTPPSPPPSYNHVNEVTEPAAHYPEQDQEK